LKDYETKPTAENKAKGKNNSRIVDALVMIAISVAVPIVTAIPFLLIFKPSSIVDFLLMFYFLFGAGGTVGGILCLMSPAMHRKNVCFGFGYAIFYGTAFTAAKVLPSFGCDESNDTILLAAIIVSLVAYLVWIKHFKD